VAAAAVAAAGRLAVRVGLAVWIAAVLGLLPASAGEYRLGAEDQLRIAVYEYPNLDGEYVVGASGAVALPLLGEVPAAGSTPGELAEAIADGLTRAVRSAARVSATVEVVEYRPFFILGDVERPGPYAYRPGLRMLQAVALAGGVYRLADVGLLRVSRDVIAAEGEIRTLEARERALGYERDRLQAELGNGEAPAFAAAAGSRDRETVERQRTVFAARREALDRQSDTLGALIGSLRDELDALDRQGALKERQVGTVEEELATTRVLVAKGLAPKARGLELERLQADIESDRQEVATEKLRVRQAIARTEQSLFGLTDERRAEVAAALEGVGRQLAETREALQTQRGLLAEATAMAPQLRRLTGEEALPLRYEVDRFGEDDVQALVAGADDPVVPGDVITVRVDDPAAAGERRAEAGR
jgi:polysaccharide export outer membrane protein/exopolysaccharide production protein ExoF